MPRAKRPRDPNQLGKLIVDLSTGEAEENLSEIKEESAEVAFARLGGLKGGPARAASLSADERRRIAKRAAKARWQRKRER